jgi:MoaA/NifB/PqqE/SkfB family radical SAM enzyme
MIKNTQLMKMGWGVMCASMGGRKIPLNVMLSLTNRCLSHCSYCDIPSRKQQELDTKQVQSLIDQISAMGCQRLGLWGGEPLIREDIAQLISYAKSKGLYVTMDSNGYLVPEKMAQLTQLDHLILAFDGPEEVHDLHRGGGSFKKVMAAIQAARKKLPLWTITVLHKDNIDSIEYILDAAKKYGFMATFQLLHHNEVLSRNQSALMAPALSYRKAIKKIIDEKRKGAPIASSYAYLSHVLGWPDYSVNTYPVPVHNVRCAAGKLYCNVDADGRVYPCSLLIEKVPASNFLEVGFKRAFEALSGNGCRACFAACFTEYNKLFSLHLPTINDWIGAMKMTKRMRKQHGREDKNRREAENAL